MHFSPIKFENGGVQAVQKWPVENITIMEKA